MPRLRVPRQPAPPDPLLELIREFMYAQHVTQKGLAEHLNVSEKHMSQIMTGKTNCTLVRLRMICDYLGLEVGLTTVEPRWLEVPVRVERP